MSAILSTVTFDKEGFLSDPKAWTRELGEAIAQRDGVTLTETHWKVILYMREQYLKEGQTPTVRNITKAGVVTMKEIYDLFPGGPAKIPAKIGGVPKPKGCI